MKKFVSKVLVVFMALAMMLTFMPSYVSAAQSTGLQFQAGDPKTMEGPLKPVLGAQDKSGWGYIAVKAIGGDSDEVVCTSQDENIAIVEAAGKNNSGYYKFNVKAVSKGETKITVEAYDNDQVKEEVPVRVEADGIYIQTNSGQGPLTLAIGKEAPYISAVAREGIDPEGPVNAKSNNEEVVTIAPRADGEAQARENDEEGNPVFWIFDLTPVAAGKTTVEIYSTEDNKAKTTINVEVLDTLITVVSGGTSTAFNYTAFNNLPQVTVDHWSGRNHAFTLVPSIEPAVGVKVESLLEAAGVDISKLADDQIIRVTPSDGTKFQTDFTVKFLLRTKRYYFPNAGSLAGGAAATEAQKANAEEVPAIICALGNSSERLVFGQVAPNERTAAISVRYMTTGGKIEVLDKHASKLACDVTANKPGGSTIAPGQVITLSSPTLFKREIYYTTDGKEPTTTSAAVYNYRTKELDGVEDGGLKNAVIKAPEKDGKFILKVRQTSQDSLDSNVLTFEYNVQAVKNGTTDTVDGSTYAVTKSASGTANGAVTFKKAKNAKNVTVPATVTLYDGKTYGVNAIGAKAFTGKKIRTVTIGANVKTIKANALKKSKATKLIIKSKKLTKKSVKGSLRGSKIKRIQVKVGTKKLNKKYAKKYRKFFSRKNAGKRVSVK